MLSLFYRVYDDAQFKQELRVLVLDEKPVAEVKFRTADESLLCELYPEIPVSCIFFFFTLDLTYQDIILFRGLIYLNLVFI